MPERCHRATNINHGTISTLIVCTGNVFRRVWVYDLVALRSAGRGFEFQLPGTQNFLVGTTYYCMCIKCTLS